VALYPSGFEQGNVRFSPDGRFVAYVANDTGRRELYIAPFPNIGAKVRISSNGANMLRWPRGSGEIMYVSGDGKMISVPVKTTPTLAIGAATELFALQGGYWGNFDVTPDGKRLLAIVPAFDPGTSTFTLVSGFDRATPPQ